MAAEENVELGSLRLRRQSEQWAIDDQRGLTNAHRSGLSADTTRELNQACNINRTNARARKQKAMNVVAPNKRDSDWERDARCVKEGLWLDFLR